MELMGLHDIENEELSVSISTEAFDPPFEMVITPEAHILVGYIPGFRKEDIRVGIIDNSECLKISGEKVVHQVVLVRWTGQRVLRSKSRRFSRAYRIPHNVNICSITAKFHDHVLYVVMPKLCLQDDNIQDRSSPFEINNGSQNMMEKHGENNVVVPCDIRASTNSDSTRNYNDVSPRDLHSKVDVAPEVDEKKEKSESDSECSSSNSSESSEEDGSQPKSPIIAWNSKAGLKILLEDWEDNESGIDKSNNSTGICSRKSAVLLSIAFASFAIFAARKVLKRKNL